MAECVSAIGSAESVIQNRIDVPYIHEIPLEDQKTSQ